MKRKLKTLMITAGVSAVLGVMPLAAQQNREIAKVPFAFSVEQRSFPAGEYTVAQLNQDGLFQMYDGNRHSIFLNAPIQTTTNPEKPHLTFSCYAKECTLAEISMPGNDLGHAFTQHAIDKNQTRKLGMVSMISIRLASR